jgi:CRISPR-associated protein Csx17
MPELVLAGCHPEPLASYLKGLGVFRLVAEQKDPEALGWWRGEDFVLASALSADDLVAFFAEEYRPTPILAPWNKDSGFYRADSPVTQVEATSEPRFAELREAVAAARAVLDEFRWKDEPRGDDKQEVIAALRSRMPESGARWIDAVVAIGEDARWAPLFVAGGADGRFEFTRAFLESLVAAVGLSARRATRGRRSRTGSRPRDGPIRAALFGVAVDASATEGTGGPLLPGSVDAPNASQGFVGHGQLNPWDYILAVEGALLLAGTVARRWGSATAGGPATFPFAVEGVSAGHPSAGQETPRGELWLPVWDRPMAFRELEHLFREGRAEWQGRPARTAADMARAIVSLGVDRGLREFRRFGVLGRSGRSHLAVSLGRWPVVFRPEAELLAELDGFMDELRRAAKAQDAPAAVVRAQRQLEGSVLAFASAGGRERLLQVLTSAAYAEYTLAARPGARRRGWPRPLRGLSGRWAEVCDDGSVEFELAAAVASLRPASHGPGGRREEPVPGEMRRHLEPVRREQGAWTWRDEVPGEVVWTGRDPLRDLAAVLERRIVEAERQGVDPPLDGRLRADPRAVVELVQEGADLARLGTLIEALALIDWERVDWSREPVRLLGRRRPPEAGLPATYALLKLAFLGRPIALPGAEVRVREDPAILGLLRAGDVWGAVVRAARRLRAAGLAVRGIPRDERRAPVVRDPPLGRRLLAALAVPVLEGPLVRAVLEEGQELADEGGEQEGAS